MASVAKIRLVYCPKCQHLLPEIAQFPVYQCGNCKAILQAKHANTKPEVHDKKAGIISSCNGAASSRRDLNSASTSGSELSNDEVEPEEVYQDRLESTAKVISSVPVNGLNCNTSYELSESRKDTDGIHGRKGSNTDISSTVLKPIGKSRKVKEAVNPKKLLPYSLRHGCEDTVSANGHKEYKNEEHYKRLSHTSGFNGVVSEDVASDTRFDDREEEAAPTATARSQIFNGCSCSSSGIDCDDLNPEQRLTLSRTLFKPQEAEITDMLTESVENNSRPNFSQTRAISAPTCSSSFINQGKMTISEPMLEPSKAAMHVHESHIKNHEEMYSLPHIRENSKDYCIQTTPQRSMISRFQLQEPSYFLGTCTTDEDLSNYMEVVHSNQEYIHSDPLVFDKIECIEQESLDLLRKVDELREYIRKSNLTARRPNGRILSDSPGLQFCETGSLIAPTQSALGKQTRSIPCFYHNEAKMQDLHQHHKSYIPAEGCLETYRQSPGSHTQTNSMPEAGRFSESPIFGQSRTCGCEFCLSDGNTIGTGQDTLRSHCADDSSVCMFCSCSHCLRNFERASQLPSCICSNQGLCRSCAGTFHGHPSNPSHACRQTHLDATVPISFKNSNHRMFVDPEHEDMYFDKRSHQEDGVGMKMKTTACRPIFGGAPFIACCSCSELLRLPDVLLSKKRPSKVKCGNCSVILSFAGSEKRHVAPIEAECRLPQAEMANKSENASSEPYTTGDRQETSAEPAEFRHITADHFQSEPISYSEEYGASIPGSYFSSDIEPSSLSTPFPMQDHALDKKGALTNSPGWIRKVKKQTSKESVKEHQNIRHANESVSRSQDINIRHANESVSGSEDVNIRHANESDSRSEDIKESFRAAPGSPLHAHFGYFSASDLLKRDLSGNNDSENGGVQLFLNSPSFGVNPSNKNLMMHELNSAWKKDLEPHASPGVPEIVNQEREKKPGKDSTISGLIRKGIRDLSLGLEGMRSKVFVNGKPIPDRLVKKAEERAGPIQPGNYWYDYQAGFWGVMGQPCLGIIPPHIEEFNFPMPRNCAGGQTGILVNDREVHQKDLDMLACRGLPIVGNRQYIINISGQVINKASGERLNLGRLAPTVQKAGRGFGMRIPKGAA